jgi:hypothetical protein
MKRRVNHMVVRSFFRTFAKEIMNDKQYLQSLISEGEHQQQDFKYRVSDPGTV